MKRYIYAALMALVLSITGCIDAYTARTIATYKTTTTLPDGTVVVKDVSYNSNKQQDGLALDLLEKDGQPTAIAIKVDKASTPEAAIAAVLQIQTLLIQQIKELSTKAALASGS